MTPRYPFGPPPEWLLALLERASELLRRLVEAARHAAQDVTWELGRAREAIADEARRRWPVVRERLRTGGSDLRAAGHRAGRRTAQAASRARAWAVARRARGWAWLRPRLGPSAWRATLVVALVALVVGSILWEKCGLEGCPDVARLTSYQPGGASLLLDRHGEPLAELAPMDYEVIDLDSLPPYVEQAFIAVEDRRFWDHGGVDWLRVVGAAWADIRAGSFVQGSSTIPMQLSRTLFPERIRREEKTLQRKVLEARVAGEIEDHYTKREILELYLNHVYLGGGSYGVQSASRYYFGKEATELTVDEAALLAALPRAPSHYDPRRYPERARGRRDLVLTLMEQQSLLPFRDAEAARQTALAVTEEPGDRDGDRPAPYFVQHVRRLLTDELGERLYAERLRIHTTLDVRAQEAAEAELESQLRIVERGAFGRARGTRYRDSGVVLSDGTEYLQGAVVLMDPRTGDILAWVGGRDYDHSRYDRARLARRQAGSAFKPFVYAAALEDGLVPSQPILDTPYELVQHGSPDWRPENYSGAFEGIMSMREALVRSQNIPAVRLAAAVGDERIRDIVRRAGIPADVPSTPVAALGVTVATPLEMTVAYATFATLGARVEPRFVLQVEDAAGVVLWQSRPEAQRVMRPDVAFVLTDMLRDVVDRGTGAGARGAGFYGVAAGKTGTTSDATDVWFIGYTPEVVGTIWVGYDEVRPLPFRATGGGIGAPIWGRIMARAYGNEGGSVGWPRPPGVVARWVDPETGMPLGRRCEPRWDAPREELFLAGVEHMTSCPRNERRRRSSRFSSWFESIFHDPPDPYIPGEPDPNLGVPRLPLWGEVDRDDGQRFYLDHDFHGRPLGRPMGRGD